MMRLLKLTMCATAAAAFGVLVVLATAITTTTAAFAGTTRSRLFGCTSLTTNNDGIIWPTKTTTTRLLLSADATTTTAASSEQQQQEQGGASDTPVENNNIDPKDAVKLFGRLAEKYIMLDPTAGMCCYSGCTDCEYRLPGGGYRMTDQSAARPKWIPCYETRSAGSHDKEHTTKWSSQLFSDFKLVLDREQFVERLAQLDYSPPLGGGPYVAASSAGFDDVETTRRAAGKFFDVLAQGKEKLTRHRMGVRIKQLSNGEEGMTFASFRSALEESSSLLSNNE